MALVSSNVSLEHYGGSRSQKNDNNVRRMLSMANVEKSRSKICHLRLQKSEKSSDPGGTD